MTRRTDAAYFSRRANDARVAAKNATEDGIVRIHGTLAIGYEALANDAEASQSDEQRIEVVAESGKVHVLGLSERDDRITPNTAERLSDSLARGAIEARRQNVE